MITERDKQRLEALIEIIKPANSIAARLETLTDEQREWHDGWKACWDRWIQCNDDDNGLAYELTLHGCGPIGLHSDIAVTLYGPKPVIPITATDDQGDRIYQDHINDHR